MLIKFPILITEDLLEIAIYLAIFERVGELKSCVAITAVASVLFSQLDGKTSERTFCISAFRLSRLLMATPTCLLKSSQP